MALFTDGPLNGTLDFQNYENGILQVVSTEQIDLGGKAALAQGEIASELMLFFVRRYRQADFPWLASVRQAIDLSDVVVTHPLRRWHAHKTLAFVYRDAYNNQLNDRYLGKWNEYEQLAKQSQQAYLQIGVGLVSGPIAKPKPPSLTAVPGAGSACTYYVEVAWVNDAGQVGSPSDASQLTTLTGQQLQVAATSPPANATGWNVYVGQSPETITLQNVGPVPLTSTWTLTTALQQGNAPGDGQQPVWFLRDQRLIERG